MGFQSFGECERILLDTTVLIDVLNKKSNSDRRGLTLQVLRNLENEKSSNQRNRKFIITSISVMEVANVGSTRDLLVSVSEMFDVGNTEIWPFGPREAEWLNKNLSEFISNDDKNSFIEKLGDKPFDFKTMREWITKDMMIVAIAATSNSDLILTGDTKTMKPIADKAEILCIPTEEEYFHIQSAGKHIEFKPEKLPYRVK